MRISQVSRAPAAPGFDVLVASVEDAAFDYSGMFALSNAIAGFEVICWRNQPLSHVVYSRVAPTITVPERAQITEPPGSGFAPDGLEELRSTPAGRSHDAQFQ
jgi:hypothetical protein